MKILLLDNYDSFTYNLAHYLRELTGNEIPVIQNDQISVDEVEAYDAIVLSPGPGLPADAGIMQDVICKFSPTKKILGICLGMQAIGEVFGGTLLNLPFVFHGVATTATILAPDEILFRGLPEKIEVGRYHSWVVDEKKLPLGLEITAIDEFGHIMALRHKYFDVRGVQFHPESILTPCGKAMVRNWLMG
ncbi:MAG: aminodeoxychorismate/anthranilate synthase component II [Bacteroidia bacterium]|nr:aminodeoxychorismate/anthranilate synthase component II [Bacteroidia bacterium]